MSRGAALTTIEISNDATAFFALFLDAGLVKHLRRNVHAKKRTRLAKMRIGLEHPATPQTALRSTLANRHPCGSQGVLMWRSASRERCQWGGLVFWG